jgi:hypothetical protein
LVDGEFHTLVTIQSKLLPKLKDWHARGYRVNIDLEHAVIGSVFRSKLLLALLGPTQPPAIKLDEPPSSLRAWLTESLTPPPDEAAAHPHT